MVVDGREDKEYKGFIGTVFSPDSRHVVYGAQSDKEQFIVVDGKEGKRYQGILIPPEGKIIFDSPDSIHYLALKDNVILSVDEKIE